MKFDEKCYKVKNVAENVESRKKVDMLKRQKSLEYGGKKVKKKNSIVMERVKEISKVEECL